MNGAHYLLKTAVAAGVDVCFANPGTTEMVVVNAMDETPGMRGVLCLFEGVCTGAADGYGRMAGKPALTLVHLGPGFANGVANLHNAKRARTPLVNIIGDHASWHLDADAPLNMDIESLAGTVSYASAGDPSKSSSAIGGAIGVNYIAGVTEAFIDGAASLTAGGLVMTGIRGGWIVSIRSANSWRPMDSSFSHQTYADRRDTAMSSS